VERRSNGGVGVRLDCGASIGAAEPLVAVGRSPSGPRRRSRGDRRRGRRSGRRGGRHRDGDDGAERGFVRLIVAPRRGIGHLVGGGRLVGATVVAPTGGDLIHEAALAMQTNVFVGRLAQTTHADPTWAMPVQQAALLFQTVSSPPSEAGSGSTVGMTRLVAAAEGRDVSDARHDEWSEVVDSHAEPRYDGCVTARDHRSLVDDREDRPDDDGDARTRGERHASQDQPARVDGTRPRRHRTTGAERVAHVVNGSSPRTRRSANWRSPSIDVAGTS